MAVGAIAGSTGMLDFGGFDELGFVVVAGDTEGFDVLLREDDFAVLRRRVADVTLLVGEGRMRELGHQLGRGGLMGIVTGEAISFFKRLVLVSLLQVGALGVMAIDAESGRGLGQMKIEFLLADLAGLVGHVAGFAAHIESGVAAAFLGNVQAGVMATEAEIFFLLAGSGLQQLVLIVGNMRVVTLQAVTLRWRMNRALELGGILVGVTSHAERIGSGGDQLDPGDIFIDANFVATGAAHLDCGVDGLALGLVLMTSKARG